MQTKEKVDWDNWVIFFQLLYFPYYSFSLMMMYAVCFFICVVTPIIIVANVSRFSDNGLETTIIPLLSRMSVKNILTKRTETIPLTLSVTSHKNSSIVAAKSQEPFPKSLLFFSPDTDIHDGTTTDLAVSLTSQNHSVFFYNGKGALPAYTGLRSKSLSEMQYLQLSGDNNKSRIIFASRALRKKSKLFAYNMKSVERLWLAFHNNALFKRADAIICMFYPSECQNYLAFNKTVIFMPAHRFLIKRCSLDDSKSLMKWMFNQPKAPVIVMAAGKYDAEYINYYSGKNVDYIYASTVLMYSPPTTYSPKYNEYLYAPFKRNQFYQNFSTLIPTTCESANFHCPVVHIREKIQGKFTYSDINSFKAVIVFPYAVLSYYLADLITAATPMFVPSPSFIVQNKINYDMKASDPSYCGKRFQEPPKHPNSKHLYSPEDYSKEATEYWLQFASYYTPCSIVFNNIPHLVQLMKSTNYSDVYECNLKYRNHIINHNKAQWNKLFQRIEVNRVMPNSLSQSIE